jgi:NADH-quinone oxidoreductase subunit N
MSVSGADLLPLLPMGILLVTAILLLMYEVFANQPERSYCANIAVIGSVIALWLVISDVSQPTRLLFGAGPRAAPIIVDAFARVASAVMISAGIVATLLSPGYTKNARCDHGEYYALILFSIIGMMVMVMAGDLFTFFLGLETMSIAVYALTGLRKNDPRSSEAALKYFLMGAFATGFLLFGIALVYGMTGSVALRDLAKALSAVDPFLTQPLLGLGLVLIVIGFAFKIAAVPFHMWAPDVYEGAPTPVTGFMAVGVKAAAFIALLRIVVVGFGAANEMSDPIWLRLLSGLAVLTILVGNALALVQQNVKRMLAYSSIAHAGYALIGVVVAGLGHETAGAGVIFYLTTYTFMTLGAFGVLTFLERRDGGLEAERFGAFAGVGYKHPALGAAMSLFMISLGGLPPTGGFFGKLYVFSAAIRAGQTGLALVGIFGSIISIYYYLRVVVAFYMKDVPDPGPTPQATPSTQLTIGLALSAAGVLYLGIYPSWWIEFGKRAMESLVPS